MPDRRLILVRHSLPEVDPRRPSREWALSVEGRRRCGPLAEALRGLKADGIISSPELKARQTAEELGWRLGLPRSVQAGLQEHDRTGTRFLPAQEFRAQVARAFAQPQARVWGAESADEAHDRFAAAVAAVLYEHSGLRPVLVSHGMVISLYVARRVGLDPHRLWRQLGLPALLVLSTERDALLEAIYELA